MSQTTAKPTPAIPTTAVPALPKIPLRDALPWLAFGMLLAMMLIYFVGAEQGAMSMIGGTQVHEFVHDARHLLGFPCH
jgi:hypothetical protein